jgi:hypothetical protein
LLIGFYSNHFKSTVDFKINGNPTRWAMALAQLNPSVVNGQAAN